LLIAGGVGAAPLSPLAEKARLLGFVVTTLLGARQKKNWYSGTLEAAEK